MSRYAGLKMNPWRNGILWSGIDLPEIIEFENPMPRFFITSQSAIGGRVILEGTDVHHVRNVLRLGPGDALTLVTPDRQEHHGVIVKVGRKSVEVEILGKKSTAEDISLDISLAQALPKGRKMELVIQKATELGVAAIHPFTSSRTVPVSDQAYRRGRLARWRRIAVESCKQCGRTSIPVVHDIIPLEKVIGVSGEDVRIRKIVLWEKAPAAWDLVFEDSARIRRFFILVGPEGGLAEHEAQTCLEAGFIPLGLGRRILRTETAALCLLAILQYQLGDMR